MRERLIETQYELLKNFEEREIYFQKIENKFLITHGFTKKSQKTPKSEIEYARNVKKLYEKGELL